MTVDLGKDGVWSLRALAVSIPRLAALAVLLMALPVIPLVVTASGAEEEPGLTLSAGETAWARLVAGQPREAARQAAAALRERGALIFGVSDKPDEASVPNKVQAQAGMKALHHLETLAVGEV